MSNRLHRSTWKVRVFRRLRAEDRASQIVEFALSLPLLVLFVVGIFDFSGAISLKQKLTNAAREAARVAAADPANDLGSPSAAQPASVLDAFYVVDNYLVSEKLNDCGLSGTLPTQTGGTLTWVSTATGCPGGGPAATLTLTINRGCVKHTNHKRQHSQSGRHLRHHSVSIQVAIQQRDWSAGNHVRRSYGHYYHGFRL